jgi:signal transduction histidine kinase
VKPFWDSSAESALRVRGWSSTTRIRSATLIGSLIPAENVRVEHQKGDAYQAWLVGEILLLGLLAAALGLFASHSSLHSSSELPHLRLVLQTVVAVGGGLVALLTGARFSAEGRRSDLLLSLGFFVASASTVAFAIAPVIGERDLSRTTAWADVVGRLFAWILIAAAPFAHGRIESHRRALGNWIVFLSVSLAVLWLLIDSIRESLPASVSADGASLPFLLTLTFGAQAFLNLLAAFGFGLRFRSRRQDLDSWLAYGATLMLFSALSLIFTPLLSQSEVSQGDFLRVLAYGVFTVGVWRAIRHAEFGRAVADERARVAREIHDGLAQYLFAISTQATMLTHGGSVADLAPQIKEAAAAAQQEARFAILALSSAGGAAPFDSALQRYVEVLTADGALEVELDIDPRIRLDPDEQIELFRIVQEGLANARKHADAQRVEVTIAMREGRRYVTIVDDGTGFDGEVTAGGQGLRNIRARIASIGGGLDLRTSPGHGTALEVTLRV